MNTWRKVGYCLLVACAAVVSQAAESYVQVWPTGAKCYMNNGNDVSAQNGRTEAYAINGAGMNNDGLTHSNACGSNASSTMWMTTTKGGEMNFLITMGNSPASFNRVKIFNCNWGAYTKRGIRKFSLWYGDTLPEGAVTSTYINENYTSLPVDLDELPKGSGLENYAGETFDLPRTISAKYFVIRITSDYTEGRSISEVQFFNRVVEAGDPYLPTADLAEVEDGFVVSGIVGNAAATPGYCALAEDGEHVYGAFAEEALEVGEEFELNVNTTDWAAMQNYFFYALASNAVGVTSNYLGKVFVGGLPADRNVWVAQPASADQRASVAENWSQGVPTDDTLPLMFASIFGVSDIVWDAGVNGLSATVPSASFTEFTHAFTVDAAVPVAFADRAVGEPFAVRHFYVGSTQPTAVTFGAGEYDVSEAVLISTVNAALGSVLTLEDGARLVSKGSFSVAKGGEVLVDSGAELFVHGTTTMNAYSTSDCRLTVRGAATFAGDFSNSGQLTLVVDGGVVTNNMSSLIYSGSAAGAYIAVKNGGWLINATRPYLNVSAGPVRLDVLSGSHFQAGNFDLGTGGSRDSSPCDVVVSNATLASTGNFRVPRVNGGCHNHFTLIGDPGETASATFANIQLAVCVAAGEGMFRTDNTISVQGGDFTASTLTIGNVESTVDGTNGFSVARANSRVKIDTLTLYENSEIRIALPDGGFLPEGGSVASPDVAPVQVTGTAAFNARSKIVVDASAISQRGTYTLLTAKTLQGLTPDRVVVRNTRANAEVFVDETSVKVSFNPLGCVVIVR